MTNYLKVWLVLTILSCLLFSCSDSQVLTTYIPSLNGHYIIIEKNSFVFPSEGGTQATTVRSNQSPWKFFDNPEWVFIDPIQGQSTSNVSFSVNENLSSDTTRMAIFYLNSLDESWSFQSYVSLTQATSTPYLDLAQTSVTFRGSESMLPVDFNTNTKFNAQCSDDWISCKISYDENRIEISVKENLTGLSRSGNIILTGAINRSINVSQEAANITGEISPQHFNCEGGNAQIKFSSETSWKAETSSSWINVTPEEGNAGDNTLVISTLYNRSTNSREGFVYLKIGDNAKLQIPVIQDGIYIRTQENLLTFPSHESTESLHVESNTEWEIVSVPEWISCSTQSGRGNSSVSITSIENPNLSSRSGKIVIGQKDFSYKIEINVEQAGLTLDPETIVLQFDDRASTKSIDLETSGSWRIISPDSWVIVQPMTGAGSSKVDIMVEENTSNEERMSTIEVMISNSIKLIKVIQTGKYFTFTQNSYEFGSRGGIVQFSFNTNENWIIRNKENKEWIILSENSGFGSHTIDITIEDNPSLDQRSAILEINPEHSLPVNLNFKQAGKYLEVDCTSLEFFAKGGISNLINIFTDGEYSITSDQDWAIVNQLNDSFTITVLPNNNLEPRKARIIITLLNLQNSQSYSVDVTLTQKAANDIIFGESYPADEDWN